MFTFEVRFFAWIHIPIVLFSPSIWLNEFTTYTLSNTTCKQSANCCKHTTDQFKFPISRISQSSKRGRGDIQWPLQIGFKLHSVHSRHIQGEYCSHSTQHKLVYSLNRFLASDNNLSYFLSLLWGFFSILKIGIWWIAISKVLEPPAENFLNIV